MRRTVTALLALTLINVSLLGITTEQKVRAFPADTLRVFIQCGTTGVAPHSARVDPIVAPGGVSEHIHTFFGSTRTNASPDYARMVAPSLDSSCDTRRDTAGYWLPQAQHAVTGEVISAQRMNVYYTNPRNDPKVVPWPDNFMAVSNDVEILGPGGTVEAGAGVRVWFRRTCWDGTLKMASPAEYVAHTRNPNGITCPAGFDTHLPKMHYNARYPVESLQSYVPYGATTGWHGDFWNTWDSPSLAAVVEACLVPGRVDVGCGRVTDANIERLLAQRGVALPPPPLPPPWIRRCRLWSRHTTP